ncbi:MAG: hypothetical protein RMJ97_10250 [Raineya sp.]|nr:hypothetical protein [Raineya sp.]
MKFINPYEVLELDTPDNSEVKKAKRRKLTEFDLSDDGSIEFKNIKIHKADFIKATDELDNEQKSQFYWSIKNNPELSNFLLSGDTCFFTNYQTQRIFSNPDFVEFVSPYFAYQYNKVIFLTFKEGNISLLKKLVANPILVSHTQIDKAYQSLREFINNQIQELHQIRTDIENEETHYEEDSVEDVFSDLQEMINVNIYNVLPTYFQSQRNEIAQKLRNISVAVFNNLNSSEVALQIIKFALQLNINNLTKQKLEKDYNQITEIHKERAEAEKYAPILFKYALAIRQLQELIQGTENNNNTSELISKVNGLVNIDDLNKQPDVFDEIREQVALAIRALSVAVFNEHSDLETATSLIKIAQKVNVTDNETRQHISEVAKDLQEIAQKRIAHQREELNQLIRVVSNINSLVRLHGSLALNQDKVKELLDNLFSRNNLAQISNFSHSDLKRKLVDELLELCESLQTTYARSFIARLSEIAKNDYSLKSYIENSAVRGGKKIVNLHNIPEGNTNSKNTGCLPLIVIAVVFGIIFAIATNEKGSNYAKNSDYVTTKDRVLPKSETDNKPTSTTPTSVESKFKGNKLPNGSSPYDMCFGEGIYGGNAWILFKNSNASDAIVCLVNIQNGRTIRNEYIQAGTNFKMTNLPSGTYYLKVFYGNDWNPEKENACGFKGGFDTDSHFSVSDSPSDLIIIENTNFSYTTGEITLYTVANGNMQQRSSSEIEFFKK